MREVVYILCALTSLVCAVLLVRSYRASRTRLLLYSSICFIGLFVNNVVLIVDELIIGDLTSLQLVRDGITLASVTALLIGLIGSAR